MDAVADTRRGLIERAAELKDSEPNFARFMSATVNSADAEDLSEAGARGPDRGGRAMLETCGSAGKGRDVKEGCTFPVTES